MDSKILKEEVIYDGKFMVKRRPGRPRKIQPHNFKAEEMVNSSNEKEVPCSDDLPEFFKIYMPALCSTMLNSSRFYPKIWWKHSYNVHIAKAVGDSWQVSVNKLNDHWFLQKGWPQFVEQNSIRDRDFLTFCYVGKSQFLVKIFSPNGCTKGASRTSKIDDETSESESSKEEINESKRRRGSVSRCWGSSITENSEEEINESKLGKVSRWGSSVGEIDGKPCFSIKLLKTCFKVSGKMCVPMEFWNAHLREHTTSKMATLWVGNDSWSVKFVITPGRVSFQRGCIKFLADNSLKIGNLCTFQLIDSNDLSFKVTSRRALHLSRRSVRCR